MSELNLYQRLLKITDEIGKIEKTGKNQQQGYGFIEQAKIVAELRPQLSKHGVMILPETIDRNVERYDVTRSNGKQGVDIHVNVVSRYTIVNVDDPEERIVCEWNAGEAIDSSDKATNKAVTASQKYFLMKLFNISDKDDGDADSPEPQSTYKARSTKPRYATMKQVELMINKVKWGLNIQDKDQILNFLDQVLDVELTKVTADSVDDALAKIDEAVRKEKVGDKIDQTVPQEDVIVEIPEGAFSLDDIPY